MYRGYLIQIGEGIYWVSFGDTSDINPTSYRGMFGNAGSLLNP